ncbi:MAG: opine dehydrogenase [Verrucomicrobiota bacterium]
MRRTNICLCGGGHLAHVLAAALGACPAVRVHLLTRNPTLWKQRVEVDCGAAGRLFGQIAVISDDPAVVVPTAKLVLLAVPSTAWKDILGRIQPFVSSKIWIGAFPGTHGFDWLASRIFGGAVKVFGLQRAPYVCRILEYGKRVSLLGTRPEVFLGAHPVAEAASLARHLGSWLHLRFRTVPNYLAITMCPGNTAFHTARLFALFGGWRIGQQLEKRPRFYEDWDDPASTWYLALDNEVQRLCAALPLDLSTVTSVPRHYGIQTVSELTRRIRTLPALRGIEVPMQQDTSGWVPDYNHRFFQEDVLAGLAVWRGVADLAKVPTPAIDAILKWAGRWSGCRLIWGNRLRAELYPNLPCPQNFGFLSAKAIIKEAIR